jgi:phage shock protein PspC (stress-responsive transcriptional regulator)
MQNVPNTAHEAEIDETARPDKLFGICEAVGEQLGFHPIYLRIALIGLLFFGPLYMVGAYVALGVVVGVSHLLFPKPRTAVAETRAVVEMPAHVEHQIERQPELIAA